MENKREGFDLLLQELYNTYDKLMINNKTLINHEDIIRINELEDIAKKYPNAYIVSEQLTEDSSTDKDFFIDIATYPSFHVRKLTPVLNITANKKIIVLSSGKKTPILEGFDIERITNCKDYLTGSKYLEMLRNQSKNLFFSSSEDCLFNHWISESYFKKVGNGWENVYFCNKRKYVNIFSSYKSLSDTKVCILDAHY